MVTGISSYAETWAIHIFCVLLVFKTLFNPLLVLFSFLLETFVFCASTHLGRYVGVISTIPFNF